MPPAADRSRPAPGGAAPSAPPSTAARLLLVAVRAYQLLLSPLLGGSCRYVPSCSQYMAEAVRRRGAVAGGWLGIKRLARCHPLGSSGFDPVPDDLAACSPAPGAPGARLR
jgi:putative membrane protein insertion efficiency factor